MNPATYHLTSIVRGGYFRLTRRLVAHEPTDIWPELRDTSVVCRPFNARFGNIALYELHVLCAVARHIGALRLFEFGTFDGLTAWHLAKNCGPEAMVYTLDLPLDHPARMHNGHDRTVGRIRGVPLGAHFQSSSERAQVTQLFGDSLMFDAAPYRGMMDFCFIDASHEYRHVCQDTENALVMARPRGGVIFWHDYSRWWPGVQQCLDALSRELPVFRVANTSLAGLVMP